MRRLGLAILLAAAPGLAAAGSFDLDALRKLPDIAALEAGCAPPAFGYAQLLPTADLLALADKLPPDRQTLAWLLFLHRGAAVYEPPIELNLPEPAAPILDRITAALAAAGLGAKADMLAKATRTESAVADLHFLDTRLPPASGSKADLAADIVAYVRRTPELAACLHKARASLPDDARLSVLVEGLVNAFAAHADPKSLPGPYRVIWLANQYVGEVDNGGVEQLFANAGPDAPETEAALRTLGLPDQADVVARGIRIFPSPFQKDRAALHDQEKVLALGDRLDALTDSARTRAVATAMAAYARREGILPQ